MTVKEIEKHLLKLDVKSRARLAEKLLHSLEALTEEENERLWAAEALRRHRELVRGKGKARSATAVLREARNRLK
jgi:exopolyphosphatase/pppGpp-phosphohydrolase